MRPSKRQRAESSARDSAGATASALSVALPSAAAALPPQPHLKLHCHALETICGFLSFDELRLVLQIASRWLEAVCSMRGLETAKRLQVDSTEQLASVMQSRLARHVGFLAGTSEPVVLSRPLLEEIAERMPFLRELHFSPLPADDWSGEMQLPTALRTVWIRLLPDGLASPLNALLESLSRHAPLTELRLEFDGPLPAHISFAPLRSLPALSKLCIDDGRADFVALTSTQCAELRMLVHLRSLECVCSEQAMLQLLQPPSNSQLQWTSLPSGSGITDAIAALIPALPMLSTLLLIEVSGELRSLDFLAQLPSLTQVHLYSTFDDEASLFHMDDLLGSLLVSIPQITSFSLSSSRLSTAQLTALMTHLPQISKLLLSDDCGFDTLAFLDPVRATLRKLSLGRCRGFSPDELLSLRDFAITDLSLKHNAPLDRIHLWALTTPSPMVPSLEHFKYR